MQDALREPRRKAWRGCQALSDAQPLLHYFTLQWGVGFMAEAGWWRRQGWRRHLAGGAMQLYFVSASFTANIHSHINSTGFLNRNRATRLNI